MKVFLAPPKGLIEKETYIEWLLAYGFKPTILEVETKITAPLILAGGADIGRDLERDAKEFWWIQQALSEGHPIIGVCRGMQILNYYFGGTVKDLSGILNEDHSAADFADNADHSGRPSQYHLVEDQTGYSTRVNSRHHQHCETLAANFTITHTGGNIIEGIEDLDRQIWAVQWHPERMESDDNLYPLDKLFAK